MAFDRGEELEDLRCVAAPVRCSHDGSVSSIWITGPASRLTDEKMQDFAELVKKAASEIESRLN